MLFGGVEILTRLHQLGLRELVLGGVYRFDFRQQALGLVQAAAKKSGRLQVVLKQVIQRLAVTGVELYRLFKILTGLGGVARGREGKGVLCPLTERTPQPMLVKRIGRVCLDRLLQIIGRLAVVPHAVRRAAGQQKSIRILTQEGLDSLQRIAVARLLVQGFGVAKRLRRGKCERCEGDTDKCHSHSMRSVNPFRLMVQHNNRFTVIYVTRGKTVSFGSNP